MSSVGASVVGLAFESDCEEFSVGFVAKDIVVCSEL